MLYTILFLFRRYMAAFTKNVCSDKCPGHDPKSDSWLCAWSTDMEGWGQAGSHGYYDKSQGTKRAL
jgi:hypothetical protein